MAVKNVFSRQSQRGSTGARTQLSLEQLVALARERNTFNSPKPRLSRQPRAEAIVTSTLWEYQRKMIPLFINPKTISWELAQRISTIKTLAGTVQNFWGNGFRQIHGPGRYYDEPIVNITFQSGNIMPSMGYPEERELNTVDKIADAVFAPKVPEGLLNFYWFLELLDQGALIGTQPNLHKLTYHSRVFPTITLIGRFQPEQISFVESATAEGNTVEWEASMLVYRTIPRFNSASLLERAYQGFIREVGAVEQLGAENMARYHNVEGVSSVAGEPPPRPPKQRETVSRIASSKATRQNIAASAHENLQNNMATELALISGS